MVLRWLGLSNFFCAFRLGPYSSNLFGVLGANLDFNDLNLAGVAGSPLMRDLFPVIVVALFDFMTSNPHSVNSVIK